MTPIKAAVSNAAATATNTNTKTLSDGSSELYKSLFVVKIVVVDWKTNNKKLLIKTFTIH